MPPPDAPDAWEREEYRRVAALILLAALLVWRHDEDPVGSAVGWADDLWARLESTKPE